jgi:hypothetical protein
VGPGAASPVLLPWLAHLQQPSHTTSTGSSTPPQLLLMLGRSRYA